MASPLNKLSLRNITQSQQQEGLPALALPDLIMSYDDHIGRKRMLLLMPLAPGVQLKEMYRDYTKNQARGSGKSFQDSLFASGRAIGNLGKYFSDAGVLGETYFHGDLNMGNIFIDGKNVTLIDNSDFAASLENKKPYWFNIADAMKNILILTYNQKTAPKDKLKSEYFMPLLRGFLSAYPQEKHKQIIEDLKINLLNPDSRIFVFKRDHEPKLNALQQTIGATLEELMRQ